jgi:hypothetical protein
MARKKEHIIYPPWGLLMNTFQHCHPSKDRLQLRHPLKMRRSTGLQYSHSVKHQLPPRQRFRALQMPSQLAPVIPY